MHPVGDLPYDLWDNYGRHYIILRADSIYLRCYAGLLKQWNTTVDLQFHNASGVVYSSSTQELESQASAQLAYKCYRGGWTVV